MTLQSTVFACVKKYFSGEGDDAGQVQLPARTGEQIALEKDSIPICKCGIMVLHLSLN